MVGMERGMPPCYTTRALCKIVGFQYSWLLDGCNLAELCMFMKGDYSTQEGVHCEFISVVKSHSVEKNATCTSHVSTFSIIVVSDRPRRCSNKALNNLCVL